MKKQRIQIGDVPSLWLDTDLFCGTPEEIAKKVLDIPNQLHKVYAERAKEPTDWKYTPWELYEDIRIETVIDHYYGDVSIEVNIKVYREETDAEYKSRKESEKKEKDNIQLTKEKRELAKEKRELELLKELKKKYEK